MGPTLNTNELAKANCSDEPALVGAGKRVLCEHMQKGIQEENRAFLACLEGQRLELEQTVGPELALDNHWVPSLPSVASLSGFPGAVF